MRIKRSSVFLVVALLVAVLSGSVVLAQDQPTVQPTADAATGGDAGAATVDPAMSGQATMDPAMASTPGADGAVAGQEGDGQVGLTVGNITGGDAANYYGQMVLVEGVISDWLSSNVFVLSDEGALGGASVLVVNNSGQPIPNSYVVGQAIIVGGRVHPSYSEVMNDPALRGMSAFEERGGGTSMTGGTSGNMGMATMDPAMASTPGAGGDAGMATMDPAMASTPGAEGAAGTGGDAGMATMDPAMAGTPTVEGGAAGTGGDASGAAVAAQPTQDPAMAGQATQDPAMAGQATMDPAMAVTPTVGALTGGQTGGQTGGMGAGLGTGDMVNPFEEDLLAWVYNKSLPDEYDVYTILELTDITMLAYPSDLGLPEGE